MTSTSDQAAREDPSDLRLGVGWEILDALPVAVAVLDHEGVIRFVNQAWAQRQSAAFVSGTAYCVACEQCFDTGADGIGAIERGLRLAVTGQKERYEAEFPGRPGPGRTRLVISSLGGGNLQGAVVVHTECPPEESQDQRRQADKVQAMGRLVGGVAHDFANLLTLISGYSEIALARLPAGDAVRADLEEIRKAATRGSRLTGQILGFARGQALQPHPLDLNALLADMELMLRPIIGEYIELQTIHGPGLGKVLADSGQIEQVIMNLVLNARDAMPRGGRIVIETTGAEWSHEHAAAHAMAPGPCVILRVTDTGQGMDAGTMGLMFEPFFTTKEKGKGTGLGLSTVYGIVRQYQGDVWAVSTPGAGTTFTIALPRTEMAAKVASTTARTQARGAETILLVEDEDSVRRLLSHILARQGYTVLEAADGSSALALLAANPVDLLLTDMVMPGLCGRETAERALAARPGLKVIYMSGYTDDVLLRTGALGPGMSFLQKPLRPEVLSTRVREALDGPAR